MPQDSPAEGSQCGLVPHPHARHSAHWVHTLGAPDDDCSGWLEVLLHFHQGFLCVQDGITLINANSKADCGLVSLLASSLRTLVLAVMCRGCTAGTAWGTALLQACQVRQYLL